MEGIRKKYHDVLGVEGDEVVVVLLHNRKSKLEEDCSEGRLRVARWKMRK